MINYDYSVVLLFSDWNITSISTDSMILAISDRRHVSIQLQLKVDGVDVTASLLKHTTVLCLVEIRNRRSIKVNVAEHNDVN